MRTLNGLSELKRAEGETLGTSGWHPVLQSAVNRFADASGDKQWIYLDPEAARATPFGGTIAPGLFTLSLTPALTHEVVRLEGFAFAINQGFNRVRFPAPLFVGEQVRLTVKLPKIDDIPGGASLTFELTFERSRDETVVCLAESLARVYVG